MYAYLLYFTEMHVKQGIFELAPAVEREIESDILHNLQLGDHAICMYVCMFVHVYIWIQAHHIIITGEYYIDVPLLLARWICVPELSKLLEDEGESGDQNNNRNNKSTTFSPNVMASIEDLIGSNKIDGTVYNRSSTYCCCGSSM